MSTFPDNLISPTRDMDTVAARRAIAHELRAIGWSLPAIGRYLNRSRWTVASYLRRAGHAHPCVVEHYRGAFREHVR